MSDAQQKIPAVCPYLGHAADQVSTPALSEKRKNNYKGKAINVKKTNQNKA